MLVALFVGAPTLGITFVGDDALRANIDGWMAVHHGTLLDAFRAELFREDVSNGRFHPLFIALTLIEMHLVHRPFPLKVAQLFAVGINVATVAFVVREVTGSTVRGLAAAIISIFMLQIRNVDDATNGDTLHLQLTIECGLLAVGLLAYSLHHKGRLRWVSYGASIFSFAASLLLYEITIPLILPLMLLSVTTSRTFVKRLALSLPFIAIVAADVFALFAVRRTWSPSPIYTPSYGLAYFDASVFQLTSTLPFLYEFVDPQAVFHATNTYWPFVILLTASALAALVGWRFTREPADAGTDAGTRARIVSLATGLALLASAAIVTASPLYQQQIRFGLPYAPVYLQGFGLAIIVSTCFPSRRVPRISWRLFKTACVVSLLVLFVSNVVVAGEFATSGYARRTIVDGLLHGAAAGVPGGVFVFLDDSYYWVNDNSYYGLENSVGEPLLWDSMYFYRQWSGRTWRTRPFSSERLREGEEAYEIRSVANTFSHGTLIIQKVRGRAHGLSPVIVDANVYERGQSFDSSLVPAVASLFASGDFTRAAGGSNWRITRFQPHCNALPNDALVSGSPSAARIVYGRGFYVAERDGALRFRWAASRASLVLVNDTAAPLVTRLHALIGTAGSAHGVLVIKSQVVQRIKISKIAQAVLMNVSLAPRSRVDIPFESNAPNVAIAGDWRDLRFRVIDPVLSDPVGCAAADGEHDGTI